MEPSEADDDQLVAQLVAEIRVAVDRPGELEAWAAERLDSSIDEAVFDRASTQVAQEFLLVDPPRTGAWEHLLVTLSFHSSRDRQHRGLSASKSILRHLGETFDEPSHGHFEASKLMTLASAMTVVLAIEDKLTQDVEATMRRLCDGFPDALPEIASQCQDIWKRRGQMSGRPGLFLWDERRQEWRLAQEFRPYRSSS